MAYKIIHIPTSGERFYNITKDVKSALKEVLNSFSAESGILHLFTPHTSCALAISEAYDPAAANDVQNFLKHLAPRNLSFITHVDEGEDDSPSHMKAILLQQSVSFIVENKELVLGTWQGIYLAEFRDAHKRRDLYLKFIPDRN